MPTPPVSHSKRLYALLPPPVEVRCLGPSEREHTFMSRFPKGERICARCRQKQKALAKVEQFTCSTPPQLQGLS